MVTLNVNGVRHQVQAPDDTPLLYVLRNDLQLIGPQFGCGLAQCGACSVLVEGKETRSCITPVASVADHIQKFWERRMRDQLYAYVAQGGNGLHELVLESVKRLSTAGQPAR